MEGQAFNIDLLKLAKYILKRIWLVIICAAVGFGAMYYQVAYRQVDTYAASGTMYVYNGNPNVVNYQYVSSGDLSSAVKLIDTYMVVVKSNKVMDSVAERLSATYPGISISTISGSLSMGSVSETGVLQVTSTTTDPQLSADICNAVLDVAPAEIIRVVSAGSAEVIDYATAPTHPVSRNPIRKGLMGALAGAALAAALLAFLFLMNRKLTDSKELESNYKPPVLALISRVKKELEKPSEYILDANAPMDKLEAYAKLRMNLLFTLVGKENNLVVLTSAISGEGKSTIGANLAVSCAMGGKKVLLVDADLRRACQRDIFEYDSSCPGLSEALVGAEHWQDCLMEASWCPLKILPAGQLPPNPAELLSSPRMQQLLAEMNEEFDLVLLDMPPINIVSDPLVLSDQVAGCVFITRQNYSDHRDIRKALTAAELTGMNVLGFAFYGEKLEDNRYYGRKYYKKYYSRYDNRPKNPPTDPTPTAPQT